LSRNTFRKKLTNAKGEKMSKKNTMQVNHENMQLVQTAPTPISVIPATEQSISARSEHTNSWWRIVATGEMNPIAFGIRKELICPEAIALAALQPNGLESQLERIKNAFYGQWGSYWRRFENQQTAALQALQTLQSEYCRIEELLREVPATRTINGLAMPNGEARLGWWGLAVSLFILNLLAITNAASYIRFQVQDWFIAFLMVAPLLFAPLTVKFYIRKLTEATRKRVSGCLACLGIASFVIFVFTLASRANPPSTVDILDGTARLGTGLIPWQLASQITMEFVIGTVLWNWLLDLMSTNAKLIINVDADILKNKLTALRLEMEPIRARLAEAEGNITELRGSLDHWLQVAKTMFLGYLEHDTRLAERLRAMYSITTSKSANPTKGE
jgi:hypothetical protein